MTLGRLLSLVVVAVLALAACGGDRASPASSTPPTPTPSVGASATPLDIADADLVLDAGWNEAVLAPVVAEFEAATSLRVLVRYGGSRDIAASIVSAPDTSADAPPSADLFLAADAGPLGAVAAEDKLVALPTTTLERVDPAFRAGDGRWVGIIADPRVVAFDRRTVQAAALPTSIDGVVDAAWAGRVGWAPRDESLQAMVTAYRVLDGYDAVRAWLAGLMANRPKTYTDDDAVLAAIVSGEVAIGLVEQSAVARQRAAQGGDVSPVGIHVLSNRDAGSLVNVAGVGLRTTATRRAAAQRFIDFLLAPEIQARLAAAAYGYPLADGVAADPGVVPLDAIARPELDLSLLRGTETTIDLLREAGAI